MPQNIPSVPQLYISIKDAAHLLGVSPRTIEKWCQNGSLTKVHLKVKGQKQLPVRLLTSEVLAMVEDWTPGEFGRGGLPRNPNSK